MEKENKLVVCKPADKSFLKTLENCIWIGSPFLLENIDEKLDPALEPVLSKNFYKSQGQWVMKLGDNMINYNLDFKMYITTKLMNPHYLPEICIKVTLLNMTVTPQGLED